MMQLRRPGIIPKANLLGPPPPPLPPPPAPPPAAVPVYLNFSQAANSGHLLTSGFF